MARRRVLAAASAAASALTVAGCAASGSESGLCPLSLEYRGETYYALRTEEPVPGQGRLADVGFACITDDEAGEEDAAARFRAETVDGVDPAVAFVVPSRWPHYLFYSGPSDASSFPPEVERLLNH